MSVGGETQSGITGKKRTRDKSVAQASTQQAPRLTDDDMSTVVNKIWKVRASFYNLGMNLKIDPGTLDVAKRKGDDGEALNSVIKKWLQKNKPKPTWKALIQALRQKNMDKGALADEIAAEYCPDQVTTDSEEEDDESDTELPKQKLSRKGTNGSDITQSEVTFGGTSTDSEAKTANNASTRGSTSGELHEPKEQGSSELASPPSKRARKSQVGGETQSGITGKKHTRDKSVAQASTQQGVENMGGQQTGGQRKQPRPRPVQKQNIQSECVKNEPNTTPQPGNVFLVEEASDGIGSNRFFRITKSIDTKWSSATLKLNTMKKGNHRNLSIPTMTIDGERKLCSFHVTDSVGKQNAIVSRVENHVPSLATRVNDDEKWFSYSTNEDPMQTVMNIIQQICNPSPSQAAKPLS